MTTLEWRVSKALIGKGIVGLFGLVFLIYMLANAYLPETKFFAAIPPSKFFLGFFGVWLPVWLLLGRYGFLNRRDQ